MDLIKEDKSWFSSARGVMSFKALSSLKQRSIFIYSYLKTVADNSFEKDNTLFKIAFLLADAIHNSNLEYSNYENLIDEVKNPILVYLKNCGKYLGTKSVFISLLAIICGKVDPKDKSAWIYDKDFFKAENLGELLLEKDCGFIPSSSIYCVNPTFFDVDEASQMIVLEIRWLFYNKEVA